MKYHIDKNGRPAVCKASTRPCPLGGPDIHFNSEGEAQAYVDKANMQAHGLLRSGNTFNSDNNEAVEEVLSSELKSYNAIHKLHDLARYSAGLSDGSQTVHIMSASDNNNVSIQVDRGGSGDLETGYIIRRSSISSKIDEGFLENYTKSKEGNIQAFIDAITEITDEIDGRK